MTATVSGSSSAGRSPRRTARPRVLLDANALMLPFRGGFPLMAEVERLVPGASVEVPASVLTELEELRRRGVAFAGAARDLAGRFPATPTSGQGDDAVLRAARRVGAVVVTADRGLAERLRRAGGSVLVPRDRHRLELRPGLPGPPPGRPLGNG